VPVHQLLGGKQRNHVPDLRLDRTSRGHAANRTSQANERARAGTRSAFPGDRTAGIFEPRESIAETRVVREGARSAGDVVLGSTTITLSVAEARAFADKLAGVLDFLEEPIRDETPEAYESLGQTDRHPLLPSARNCAEVAVPPLHRARHPSI
jgi:galactonate dehydratase